MPLVTNSFPSTLTILKLFPTAKSRLLAQEIPDARGGHRHGVTTSPAPTVPVTDHIKQAAVGKARKYRLPPPKNHLMFFTEELKRAILKP